MSWGLWLWRPLLPGALLWPERCPYHPDTFSPAYSTCSKPSPAAQIPFRGWSFSNARIGQVRASRSSHTSFTGNKLQHSRISKEACAPARAWLSHTALKQQTHLPSRRLREQSQAAACSRHEPGLLAAMAALLQDSWLRQLALGDGENTGLRWLTSAGIVLPWQCPSKGLCSPGAPNHGALGQLGRNARAVVLFETGMVCMALCEVLDEQAGLSWSIYLLDKPSQVGVRGVTQKRCCLKMTHYYCSLSSLHPPRWNHMVTSNLGRGHHCV